MLEAIYQPVDFQMDASIDQVVEVAAGGFQRQSVGVRQKRSYHKVKFCWEAHEAMFGGSAVLLRCSLRLHV